MNYFFKKVIYMKIKLWCYDTKLNYRLERDLLSNLSYKKVKIFLFFLLWILAWKSKLITIFQVLNFTILKNNGLLVKEVRINNF